MIQQREVRERLASLIAGKLSLAAFERWLASESWNMFNESEPNEIELVAAINLLVSELHDRVINQQQFHDELSAMLNELAPDVIRVKLSQASSANTAAWLTIKIGNPKADWFHVSTRESGSWLDQRTPALT